MTNIVFLRTRYNYDSYTDFWRLAELSGFPIIYVDELRLDQEGVYITAPYNGEHKPHILNETERIKTISPRMAHLVLWNLERPSGSGLRQEYIKSNRQHVNDLLFDEIWVSDRRLADDTRFRYVTLGSDFGLGEPGHEKKYDFCHMSAPTPRRTTIFNPFVLTIPERIGPNCWPRDAANEPDKYQGRRDEVMKQSRFALNVHQDNYPYQEPLRFALFAAYGLPMISEYCFDAWPYSEDTGHFVAYEGLVGSLQQALDDDYQKWKELGQRMRELMCIDFQFGKMVREAIEQSSRGNGWR